MPKELIPIQYPIHRGPPHYPIQHQRHTQQQPPPSNAAAKAAAAAKALHRRALDRAQQKQPSATPPQQPQNDERNADRRRSTMAVFRRPPNENEDERFRIDNNYTAHLNNAPPGALPQAHPGTQHLPHGCQEEFKYEKSEGPPAYPQQMQMPTSYPPYGMPAGYPNGYSYMAPTLNYPENTNNENNMHHYYDPRYYDPNIPNGYVMYPPPHGYPYVQQGNGNTPAEPPPMDKNQEQRGSTRRIIGSHTPIHVPRADSSFYNGAPMPNGMPNNITASNEAKGAPASVFRSQEGNIAQQERNAHEILLSLSKSFDKRDSNDGPMSPQEPPRLKQFHKQRGDGFEPQPSPSRPDNTEDTSNDIEFASSFNLFNQSFDMNIENLLGPNSSFGLGPMKSLSFGMGGIGGTFDDADRASPINIDNTKDKKDNVQVLLASPSNDFGNVLNTASSSEERKQGVMVLGDSIRVASPSGLEKKRSSPTEMVLDGNARTLPFKLKGDEKERENADIVKPPKKKKVKTSNKVVDLALYKVIENHRSAFDAFTFLLPGAKRVLSKKKKNATQMEIARRRINSALCAFGGAALPREGDDNKTVKQKKYEELLSKRYYEDDNCLSWEVEEDSPVEISDEEASTTSKSKLSSCDSMDYPEVALQRNMGIMVYPAINAFVAAEPGIITPALTEMNNTAGGKKCASDCTPAKGASTVLPPASKSNKLPMVSPDNVKLGVDLSSPDKNSVNFAGGVWISTHQVQGQSKAKKEIPVPHHLFINTQELVPEQYLEVSDNKYSSYNYPSLPVPYAQRKRMSNAVFAMSKSIPGLTDECAAVLSKAREDDAWDFAVAELMTQVVVLTQCDENDERLDGLSKYLLALGIAC